MFIHCINSNSKLSIQICTKTIDFIFFVDKKGMRVSTLYTFETNSGFLGDANQIIGFQHTRTFLSDDSGEIHLAVFQKEKVELEADFNLDAFVW